MSPALLQRLVLSAALLQPMLACAKEPRGIVIDAGMNLPFVFTYVEQEVEREFLSDANRPAGYYAVLQERTNAPTFFDGHISIALVLEDLVARYSFSSFGWDEATITHISRDRVEIINNQFIDATATYASVDSLSSDERRSLRSVLQPQDISGLDLSTLQVHTLDGGYRYYFLADGPWAIWASGEAGLAIATFSGPGELFFGLHLAPTFGASYNFSKLLGVEVEARYNILITEAPDSLQNRFNHAVVTGDRLTSLVETFQFLNIQVGLRMNFEGLN